MDECWGKLTSFHRIRNALNVMANASSKHKKIGLGALGASLLLIPKASMRIALVSIKADKTGHEL